MAGGLYNVYNYIRGEVRGQGCIPGLYKSCISGLYRAVPGLYRAILGLYRAVLGLYRAVPGLYRAVPGLYRGLYKGSTELYQILSLLDTSVHTRISHYFVVTFLLLLLLSIF